MGAFVTAAGGLSEFGVAMPLMAGTGAAMWKNDNDVWDAAQGDGENGGVQGGIKSMNSLLQNAMMNAIGSSTDYTEKAIKEQRGSLQAAIDALGNSLGTATNAVNTGLFNANQAATTNVNRGLQNSQILQSPYAGMGYGAADAYSDSLGISRPQMGSQNLVNSMFQYQQLQPQLQQLQAAAKTAGQNPFEMGAAPTAPTAPTLFNLPNAPSVSDISQAQIDALISQNLTSYFLPGVGDVAIWKGLPNNLVPASTEKDWGVPGLKNAYLTKTDGGGRDPQAFLRNQEIRDWAAQQVLNPLTTAYNNQYGGQIAQNKALTDQYNTAMTGYNDLVPKYNTYGNLFNQMSNTVANIDPNVMRNAMAASGGLFGRGM